MLCEEIMKRDVACVSPDDTAQSAARLMLDENVGFLPICEESKKVIGTITDRDLAIRLVAGGLPAQSKIGPWTPVCCAPAAAPSMPPKITATTPTTTETATISMIHAPSRGPNPMRLSRAAGASVSIGLRSLSTP